MISLVFLIFSAAVAVGIYKAFSSTTSPDENNRVLSPNIRTVLNRPLDLCSPVRTTGLSSSVESSSPSTCDVQSDLDKTVDLWGSEELHSQVYQDSKDSSWTPLKTSSPFSTSSQDDLNRTAGLGTPFMPKSNISPDESDLNRTVGLGTPFLPKNNVSPDERDLNRTVGLGSPFLPKGHVAQDIKSGPLSPVQASTPFSTRPSTTRSTRSLPASRIPKRVRVHLHFEDTSPPTTPKPQRVDARDLILEIQSPCTLIAQVIKQKYFPNTPPLDEEISEEEDEEIRRLRTFAFKKRPSQVSREARALIKNVRESILQSRMRRMLRQLCRQTSLQ